MKNLILVSSLILCGLMSRGQDCKYVVNTEDKFTKLKKLEIEAVTLCEKVKNEGKAKIKDIGMVLRKDGDKRYFTLVYSISGEGAQPSFHGNGHSKLVLLLSDKSTVELPMAEVFSDEKMGFWRRKLELSTHFELSAENYSKLISQDFTDVRALATFNPFDFQVKEGVKTSSYFNCIK